MLEGRAIVSWCGSWEADLPRVREEALYQEWFSESASGGRKAQGEEREGKSMGLKQTLGRGAGSSQPHREFWSWDGPAELSQVGTPPLLPVIG